MSPSLFLRRILRRPLLLHSTESEIPYHKEDTGEDDKAENKIDSGYGRERSI